MSYRTTGAGSATLPAFQASGSGRIHPSPTLEQHLAALESRVNGLVNDLRAAEERQQQAVNSLRDGLAVEKQTADRRTRTATALIGAGAVLQMVAVVGAAAG